MALIDKKQESYYIKNNEVVHMFNANDVKEVVLDLIHYLDDENQDSKLSKTIRKKYKLNIMDDIGVVIIKMFGDFQK
jgi:replicative superfamily II helicase